MLGMTTTSDPGMTGVRDIAVTLGGGIRESSLILIEGEANTGKSVLSQYIAYGILHSKDTPVAYYSSDYNPQALVTQMDSMSLDTTHHLVTDRLRIYRLGQAISVKDAETSLKLILDHVENLPSRFKLVIVDSPSTYMTRLSKVAKVDFLQACKELCEKDRSILLTLDTHVFEPKTLKRAYAMSDYYIRLRSQDMVLGKGQLDTRVIKSMEVTKLGGAEREGQGVIKFEIKPRVGLQFLPIVQVKI